MRTAKIKAFTIDEQIEYIKHVLALQTLIASRLGVSLVNDVLESLLERLVKVYNKMEENLL